MQGLICPDCKHDKHDPAYEKDNLYVCSSCGKILGYLCRGCDKLYLENRLGRITDYYVCKECGTIQWGYTEYQRNKKGETT